MVENKLFKTLVKNGEDVKEDWRDNDYVLGRVSGMKHAICGNDKYMHKRTANGMLLKTKCYPEKYVEFMKTVEECYPGLCEFNYVEN